MSCRPKTERKHKIQENICNKNFKVKIVNR